MKADRYNFLSGEIPAFGGRRAAGRGACACRRNGEGCETDILGNGITGVAAITVICYLICQAVKATALDNKWLPIVAGASGLLLGIAGLYVMPDFPASDVITAGAVGVVSGLAATGANQVFKQLTKQ